MKPGVPWSVKGIEPDARAAAKVAAAVAAGAKQKKVVQPLTLLTYTEKVIVVPIS